MLVAVVGMLFAGWMALLPAPVFAQADERASLGDGPEAGSAAPKSKLAILPFEIHSARDLGDLSESLPQLLAQQLESAGTIEVIDPSQLESLGERGTSDLTDAELRALADQLGVDAVVAGSLTELAGRFSLDLRVTPAQSGARSHTVVLSAGSEDQLVANLDELSSRVAQAVAGAGPGQLVSVTVAGAGDLSGDLRAELESRVGDAYDPDLAAQDAALLRTHPLVADVTVEVDESPEGTSLRYQVVRRDAAPAGPATSSRGSERIAEVLIDGNRRIEADAIRARIRSRKGERLSRSQLASDVKAVYGLGFFRNVSVEKDDTPKGVILTFHVIENPVIRQISIEGNDNIEGDKIRDALTLTTGSTLDYPLLHENTERMEALYRAEGYYLASVTYQVERLSQGSVAVNFRVKEDEKLRLKEINFVGNEAFTSSELKDDFATKTWKFYSLATSWFDKTGTYSEPVFIRDLRSVEKMYTDAGYLQVEVGEPEVDASKDGLVVTVKVREGPQFHVGDIEVTGDQTVDLAALREKLRLEEGEVFNRSALTEDVEALEAHYTDRGFYFASVQPVTQINVSNQTVNVDFQVKKGPLYFIRHINIAGNTRTVDEVIRREMQVVEGQLYSARALQISNIRVRGLGFFEDVTFEPRPTQDPSQLDLDVQVVERPTGSLSFGAGFSSQDKLVFTGSLAQSNLFGRGYGVNLSADFGSRTRRFFASWSDPYFLDTNFSFGLTGFLTDLRFQSFDQTQAGVDFNLGHALTEDNTARGFLRYSFALRKVQEDNRSIGAAPILREIRQGTTTTSLVGVSFRSDTRDDRFSPTSGMTYGATLEYSGLGGFTKFLRAEARFSWYLGAPDWLLDRSTFVVSTRLGYALPFNQIGDFAKGDAGASLCSLPDTLCGPNVADLANIDTDLKLPLTERYFLGGIGPFQLRGYKARSVGPLRSVLTNSGLGGQFGDVANTFYPNGRQLVPFAPDPRDPNKVVIRTECATANGCNDLSDKKTKDFANYDQTDVVGGNSFITSSLEYRFPISEEVGLQGVIFLDMGNAFFEGENLFDVTEWRYGSGGGVLWFSPFGPLQVILGFPIDPEPFEKSPVFEFSVGGFGQ